MYVACTTLLVLYKIEPYPTYKHIGWPPWCVQLRNYKAMPTQSPLKQPSYNLPALPLSIIPHGDTPLLTCTTLTGTLEYIYSTTLKPRPLPPPTGTLVKTYQYIHVNPLPTEIPIHCMQFFRCIHPQAYQPPPNWVNSYCTWIPTYVYHVMFTNVYRNPTQSGTLIHGYSHVYTMLYSLIYTIPFS